MMKLRMKLRALWIGALVLMGSHASSGQDLTGDWQGTLGIAPRRIRLIVHIEKSADSAWKGTIRSIDQSPDWGVGTAVDSVMVSGASFKLAIAALKGSYEGAIAADGNSIVGIWTQARAQPLTFTRATPETAWQDPSPHTVRFVSVAPDVTLEVLDWSGPSTGSRRTLVLVPGLGNTAHIFDRLAPRLTARYHVVAVTRRGFGASSAPTTGYGADRLGDDVLAVIDELAISKPVLVGHSLGGEELSSIASRYPQRVAGLIYLDAAYSYAFYVPGIEPFPGPPATPLPPIAEAIMNGVQRYATIPVPILAVYALPHDLGPAADAAARTQGEANDQKAEGQAKAFERGVPTARVVRIPANHFLFLSNEADVVREMETFLGGLK